MAGNEHNIYDENEHDGGPQLDNPINAETDEEVAARQEREQTEAEEIEAAVQAGRRKQRVANSKKFALICTVLGVIFLGGTWLAFNAFNDGVNSAKPQSAPVAPSRGAAPNSPVRETEAPLIETDDPAATVVAAAANDSEKNRLKKAHESGETSLPQITAERLNNEEQPLRTDIGDRPAEIETQPKTDEPANQVDDGRRHFRAFSTNSQYGGAQPDHSQEYTAQAGKLWSYPFAPDVWVKTSSDAKTKLHELALTLDTNFNKAGTYNSGFGGGGGEQLSATNDQTGNAQTTSVAHSNDSQNNTESASSPQSSATPANAAVQGVEPAVADLVKRLAATGMSAKDVADSLVAEGVNIAAETVAQIAPVSAKQGGAPQSFGIPIYPGDRTCTLVFDVYVISEEPGPVVGELNSCSLSGATVLGQMQVNSESISFQFNRLTYRGKTVGVNAVAIDRETHRVGLADDVDHHYLSRWGGIFAAAFGEGYLETMIERRSTYDEATGRETVVTSPIESTSDRVKYAFGKVGKRLLPMAETNFNRPNTISVFRGSLAAMLFLEPVEI